jgi:class 3 adenylate cyclase/CHASE3 domain sensor protein
MDSRDDSRQKPPCFDPNLITKVPLRFLRNWSIARKVSFGFALILLGAVLTAAAGVQGLITVSSFYQRTIERGLGTQMLAHQAKTALLQARRREKDFMLRWKTEGLQQAEAKYLAQNASELERLRNVLDRMEVLLDAFDTRSIPGLPSAKESVVSAITDIESYSRAFSQLVELIRLHGHIDTGLEGRFRQSAHDIEDILENVDNARLSLELLELRRHEKDYLLRHASEEVVAVSAYVASLLASLKASLVNEESQRATALLRAYYSDFSKLVAIDEQIKERQEVFRAAAHRIEDSAETVIRIGETVAAKNLATAAEEAETALATVGAIVVTLLLLSIGFAVVLSRHLKIPLRMLTQAAREFSRPDMSIRAPVLTGDEVGEVATTFNAMADQLSQQMEELESERATSERLLLNILPEPVALRLKGNEELIADRFGEVTVLFADLVGFSKLSTEIPPSRLVTTLNRVFSAFDVLAERHGVEKIKTIGDAYMAVGGLPVPLEGHAQVVARMAIDMVEALEVINHEMGLELQLRVGINTGAVIAGVIGKKKFVYDLWGDAVNIASRMESHGVKNRIQVSEETYRRLGDAFAFEERGEIEVKGKGTMRTWLLIGSGNTPAAQTV